MLETLLGGVLGGVFRLVPEVIKWLDRKSERAHELAMHQETYRFQQLTGDQKIGELRQAGQNDWNKGALETLEQALAGQAPQSFRATGHKLVDFLLAVAHFLNVSVRPVITYWFFALYCASKIAVIVTMVSVSDTVLGGLMDAIKFSWTGDDMALLAGILNFWFLNRVFEKAKL